jgi:hypothetical protein
MTLTASPSASVTSNIGLGSKPVLVTRARSKAASSESACRTWTTCPRWSLEPLRVDDQQAIMRDGEYALPTCRYWGEQMAIATKRFALGQATQRLVMRPRCLPASQRAGIKGSRPNAHIRLSPACP